MVSPVRLIYEFFIVSEFIFEVGTESAAVKICFYLWCFLVVRAEENKLRAEKKRRVFNELKKSMEDAEARKIEDKRLLVEEEIQLRQEADKIDQLNDMRREEEK